MKKQTWIIQGYLRVYISYSVTAEENLILFLHSLLRKPRCNPFTITMSYNVVAKAENSLKNSDKFHRIQ